MIKIFIFFLLYLFSFVVLYVAKLFVLRYLCFNTCFGLILVELICSVEGHGFQIKLAKVRVEVIELVELEILLGSCFGLKIFLTKKCENHHLEFLGFQRHALFYWSQCQFLIVFENAYQILFLMVVLKYWIESKWTS